ncbi:ComF family protein [bacterium]|nr:ComF family protein [bacterium]
MAALKTVLHALRDFIYPPVCPLCDALLEHDGRLCGRCQQRLEQKARPVFHGAGDFHHLDEPLVLDRVLTVWIFSRDLEKLVHLVKYAERKQLGCFLGDMAARILNGKASGADLIIPVPLHRRRQRERGFNQSLLIAERLGGDMGIPVMGSRTPLRRIRYTETQTSLNAAERQFNVRDAFRVVQPDAVSGKHILIVDDVITSGATINACARACRAAGAAEVTGLGLTRPVLG